MGGRGRNVQLLFHSGRLKQPCYQLLSTSPLFLLSFLSLRLLFIFLKVQVAQLKTFNEVLGNISLFSVIVCLQDSTRRMFLLQF